MQGQMGESSYGLPQGTQSSQQQVWTISINAQAQFASHCSQPLHSLWSGGHRS